MEIIKINRLRLLETLKKNREAHAEEYLLAEKGYWLEVETVLAKKLKEIRKTGILKGDEFGRFGLNLSRPQDHTTDYDVIISMLEYSVDDVIELDNSKFQNYVMDNWQWSGSVKSINSYFANVAGAAR